MRSNVGDSATVPDSVPSLVQSERDDGFERREEEAAVGVDEKLGGAGRSETESSLCVPAADPSVLQSSTPEPIPI